MSGAAESPLAGAPLATELDERVDGHEVPGRRDDQRVDVDAADVRAVAGEPAQRLDDRGHGVAIDGGFATERTEQALAGQLVEHLVGRHRVDRRRSEHDVGDGLGEDAADAEHHGRPELAVPRQSDHQLAGPVDHRRDEQRHRAVGGRGRGEELGGGLPDGVRVGEPETDQAALGLVGDRIPVELDDDGTAERKGHRHGLVGIVGEAFLDDRDVVLREQRLGVGFRQRAWTPSWSGQASWADAHRDRLGGREHPVEQATDVGRSDLLPPAQLLVDRDHLAPRDEHAAEPDIRAPVSSSPIS